MTRDDPSIRLFLCGDVMTGRGIDQVLPHPCPPHLYESYAASALHYVALAEEVNGPIPRPAAFASVWGAALAALQGFAPDARIINLETSITRCETHAAKGINYRMSPENAPCLTAAGIDCCVLANNHVLDWGRTGLIDTLMALDRLGIKRAGAGRNAREAREPAVLEVPDKGRVLVFSYASTTGGTPRSWSAEDKTPGVNLLPDLDETGARKVADQIRAARQANDLVIISVHWGSNWGYDIPDAHRRFAHALIDQADVAIVHGHSSHHAKAIEVHRNRLILYGCGDFLNDYEGIPGYEDYRDDLAVMYLPRVAPATGDLVAVDMLPLRIRRFQLTPASTEDVHWLKETLDRESRRFGTRVVMLDGRLGVTWR